MVKFWEMRKWYCNHRVLRSASEAVSQPGSDRRMYDTFHFLLHLIWTIISVSTCIKGRFLFINSQIMHYGFSDHYLLLAHQTEVKLLIWWTKAVRAKFANSRHSFLGIITLKYIRSRSIHAGSWQPHVYWSGYLLASPPVYCFLTFIERLACTT